MNIWKKPSAAVAAPVTEASAMGISYPYHTTADEVREQMRRMREQHTWAAASVPEPQRPPSLNEQIMSRFGLSSWQGAFDFLHAHRTSPDRVVVFVVKGESAVVLEDGNLFPSDALVTQLRLIKG